MLSKAEMDRRYAEKVKAKHEGRVPVLVTSAPLPRDAVAAADARIREKLARHNAAPVVVKPAPKADAEAKEPKADKKSAPKADAEAKG